VLVSSLIEEHAQSTLKGIFDDINAIKRAHIDGWIYLACMRCPLKRIQKNHRMQIIARVLPDSINTILRELYAALKNHESDKCTVFVEVNPSNLS
jgi:primosomal protein N'